MCWWKRELNVLMHQTHRHRIATGTTSFTIIGMLMLVGCAQDEPPPPSHNRHFITPQGHFVGHLKPEPIDGPPVGIDGRPIQANDPVVWIVDGGKVSQPEYEIDVSSFRLDFNEKEPLTEAVLPFPLMTETSKQVVVHRGPPPESFSHPEINNGEACHPIFQCVNPDCPRVKEIDNAALFPVPTGTQSPMCPFCQGSKVGPYTMPQQRNMRDFMTRHPE